ncbi:hypothetical protein Tco_0537203 [Tanacetum coccineum]
MAEQQENQQQDRPDEEVVPVTEKVKIGLSNYIIALEKQQPDIIYKLCLTILKQFWFFNAFTATTDITPTNSNHSFVTPPPHDDIVSFIKELGYLSYLEQHVIKIDAFLRNLKFINKGEKDPKYGMAIPLEMMSEEIKASADYLNYLAKSMGTQPVKGKGKRLLTNKGIEVTVQKIETLRVPKKKRTETVIEETAQLEEESKEETLDYSKKLKGIKTLSSNAQYLVDMKTATKLSKDDFILKKRSKGPGEISGVIPKVPDGPSDNFECSSSEYEDEERFLSTDDEASQEKSDKERTKTDNTDADAGKKDEDAKDTDEQAREEQAMDEQARIKQDGKVQAEVSVPEPQVEKLAEQLLSSSLTLSSAEYGNQFINDNPDVSLIDALKDPDEIEI